MSVRCLLIVLLLSSIAYAQTTVGYLGTTPIIGPTPIYGAALMPTSLKYSWNFVDEGICSQNSQCLVNSLYNPSLDTSLAYFMGTTASTRPKCIDTGDYILDRFCVDGAWSSRTRRVAEQLLALAYGSISGPAADKFALFCDSYENVLNNYDYVVNAQSVERFIKYPWCEIGVRDVPCANNFCVLKYPGGIAFGTSLNVPVNDDEDSFLLALNKTKNFCDNAFMGDSFASCGDDIWYNEALNAVVYADEPALPAPSPAVRVALEDMFDNVKSYAFNYVHDPVVSMRDYSFLNLTPAFDSVFVGLDGNMFGFSLRADDITDLHINYSAWYFLNVDFTNYTCGHYFRKDFDASYDPRVHCMEQPYPNSFFVLAFTGPPIAATDPKSIVGEWPLFTGGLRI